MYLQRGHSFGESLVRREPSTRRTVLCIGLAMCIALSCVSCTSLGKKVPPAQTPPPVQQDTAVFGTYDAWNFHNGTWVKKPDAKLVLTESSMVMTGTTLYPTQGSQYKEQQLVTQNGQIAKYATVNGERMVSYLCDYYLQSPAEFGVPILWLKTDWTNSATMIAAPDPASALLEDIAAYIPDGLTPSEEAFSSLTRVKNVPFRHFWQDSTDIFGMAFYKDYLLVSDFAAPCIDSLDISNPENAKIVGTWKTNQTHQWDNSEGILIHGQTAYVASSIAGIRVLSLNDPANPEFVRQINTGISYTVTRSGNSTSSSDHVLYTNANNTGSFVAVDLKSPNVPVLHTFQENGGNAWNYDIVKKGQYLYCAGGDRFLIYDASNAISPELLSTIVSARNDNTVQSVCIAGDYAFVHGLSGEGSIEIVSVSNPKKPLIVYTIDGLYSGGRIAVHGGYLFYIGPEQNQGLYVFDIKDPENPVMVTYYPDIHGHNIAFKDSYVYVTSGANGLNIYKKQ